MTSRQRQQRSRSIRAFRARIAALPSDRPVDDPRVWYRTQKEHWLGWLGQYHTAGAYGRQVGQRRDARFAYNHVVEAKMLRWLIDAAGVDRALVRQARRKAGRVSMLQRKSRVVREVVPWGVVEAALWPRVFGR